MRALVRAWRWLPRLAAELRPGAQQPVRCRVPGSHVGDRGGCRAWNKRSERDLRRSTCRTGGSLNPTSEGFARDACTALQPRSGVQHAPMHVISEFLHQRLMDAAKRPAVVRIGSTSCERVLGLSPREITRADSVEGQERPPRSPPPSRGSNAERARVARSGRRAVPYCPLSDRHATAIDLRLRRMTEAMRLRRSLGLCREA